MCMCGDSMCGSCHPGAAQAEARFDECYESAKTFLAEPSRVNAKLRNLAGVPIPEPTVSDIINAAFDDGSEDGLTRLAAFIIEREDAAIERARAEDAATKAELLAYEQEAIAQTGYESLRDAAADRENWLDFVNAASDEPQEFYED